jgi:hypothetical protein
MPTVSSDLTTSARLHRLLPCQRGPPHDGDSLISDADCLIRLDNFRIDLRHTGGRAPRLRRPERPRAPRARPRPAVGRFALEHPRASSDACVERGAEMSPKGETGHWRGRDCRVRRSSRVLSLTLRDPPPPRMVRPPARGGRPGGLTHSRVSTTPDPHAQGARTTMEASGVPSCSACGHPLAGSVVGGLAQDDAGSGSVGSGDGLTLGRSAPPAGPVPPRGDAPMARRRHSMNGISFFRLSSSFFRKLYTRVDDRPWPDDTVCGAPSTSRE